MTRRSMERRMDGVEGRVGTGGRMLKVEFYNEARDGTLVRLPMSDGDEVEAEQTIRVLFVHSESEGNEEAAGD